MRIALVGCGGISQVHREHLAADSGLRVTAAVDVDPARAQAAAAALPGAAPLTELDEALPLCDAALLALPHHLHHPIGMRCLRAGKHVLMEKPLANTEAECLDLIGEAESRRLTLMVAYCMRFHPLVEEMQRLIAEQVYGETFHSTFWTEQLTIVEPGSWVANARTLGGGQLFSHGCHYVDVLLATLGRPVQGVHVGTRLGTPWMEGEGTSDVAITFEGGAVGCHAATWGARGSRLSYAWHAHATEGTLVAEFATGRLFLLRGGAEEQLLDAGPMLKHMGREVDHFAQCVSAGARPLTDGARSLQGLRVIWRLYEAEREGRVADLRGLGLDEPWR